MDNKGQTLVLFVILLPLLFVLLALVIDIGLLVNEKSKVDNAVKDSIKSSLKSEPSSNQIVEERVAYLINSNIEDIKIKKIEYKDSVLYVSVSKNYKTLFARILSQKNYSIDMSFKAYIENDEVIIKKE